MAQSTWKTLVGGTTNSQSYPPAGTVFARDAINIDFRTNQYGDVQTGLLYKQWGRATTTSSIAMATV